jgi:hypothetical protein
MLAISVFVHIEARPGEEQDVAAFLARGVRHHR